MKRKEIYISKIVEAVKQESTCKRGSVGAVYTTPDYEILSTGYNGSPRGFPHCTEAGCEMKDNHCVRTIHAEINGIIQAAKNGTSLKGSYLFVSFTPCKNCAMALVNLGISRVYILKRYGQVKDGLTEGEEILNKGLIPIIYFNN